MYNDGSWKLFTQNTSTPSKDRCPTRLYVNKNKLQNSNNKTVHITQRQREKNSLQLSLHQEQNIIVPAINVFEHFRVM